MAVMWGCMTAAHSVERTVVSRAAQKAAPRAARTAVKWDFQTAELTVEWWGWRWAAMMESKLAERLVDLKAQ